MNRTALDHVIRFVLLVLVQVLILNNLHLGSFFHPMLYVLFILTLPFNTPGWLLLLLSFFLGLSIDIFSQTPGMHAAATVFVAFLRPAVLRMMALREDYQPEMSPTIKHMGLRWFLPYSLILLFAHNLFLFYAEVFSFTDFWFTLLRALGGFMCTMMLVIVAQLLFQTRAK